MPRSTASPHQGRDARRSPRKAAALTEVASTSKSSPAKRSNRSSPVRGYDSDASDGSSVRRARLSSASDSDEDLLSLPLSQSSRTRSSQAKKSAPSEGRSSRPQRQAAANAPKSYAIDPMDDHSRLRRKPGTLESFFTSPTKNAKTTTASPKTMPAATAVTATSPADKAKVNTERRKAMQAFLAERRLQQERDKGQGLFAAADAVISALRTEEGAAIDETLREQQAMASKKTNASRVASRTRANDDDAPSTGDEREDEGPVDSFYWSSDDSCSTCRSSSSSASYASAREALSSSSPSKATTNSVGPRSCSPARFTVPSEPEKQVVDSNHAAIVDALKTNLAKEPEDQAIIDIVQQDLDPRRDAELCRARKRMRKAFWRSCRVGRPRPEDMEQDGSNTEEKQRQKRLLLSGALPLLYATLTTSTPSLCVWLFFQWVLSDDFEVRQRSHEALADLMQRHVSDLERETTVNTIAAQLPRLLVLLGAKASTISDCFSLPADHLDADIPAGIRRNRPRSSVAGEGNTVDLGQTWMSRLELWMILSRLVQAVRVLSACSHTPPKRPSGHVQGLFVALLLLRAGLDHGTLKDEVGQTLSQLLAEFSSFSVLSRAETSAEVDCSKLWDVLSREGLEGRLEVLRAFPANDHNARTIRRWLAWRSLIGDDDAAAQRGLRYVVPELGRLAAIIDDADPRSPFYVSTPAEDRKEDGIKTDYGALGAATELMGIALSDVALQICKAQDSDEAKPEEASTPRHIGVKLQHFPDTPDLTASPIKPKDVADHSRALDLALAPYRFLRPKRRSRRVEAMRSIVERLRHVSGEVLDLQDSTLERARVKDALLRLYLSLDYQITMYEARPRKREVAAASARTSKFGLTGKVSKTIDREFVEKLNGSSSSGHSGPAASTATPSLIPGQGAKPRFTTTPSFSSSSADSGQEPGRMATVASLPEFARPTSPTKERRERRERPFSPSLEAASKVLGTTNGNSIASPRSQPKSNAQTSNGSASKEIAKRARPSSPDAKPPKKTRSSGAKDDGKQRKLTSFFGGKPEVVVPAPLASSPLSLRGGKVVVDASDSDEHPSSSQQQARRTSPTKASPSKKSRKASDEKYRAETEDVISSDDDAESEDGDENVTPRPQRPRREATAQTLPETPRLQPLGSSPRSARGPPPRRGAGPGHGGVGGGGSGSGKNKLSTV